MPVSFAGRPCLDPVALYKSCRDANLSTEWVDKPNSFACPLGCDPGEGWLLLAKSDLDAISPDGTFPDLYDLVFGDGTNSVTLKNLVLVSARCLTPGAAGGDAAYLVRVADRRWFLARTPLDVAYNVRYPGSGALSPGTLTPPGLDIADDTPLGAAWAWPALVADVWSQCLILGAFPGLPFSPDGTPGEIEFYQRPASEALGSLLERLGCALRLDPTADSFSVVRLGEDDPAASADLASATASGLRVWDGYPVAGVRATIPASVRVLFRCLPWAKGSTFVGGIPQDPYGALEQTPYLSLDVPDPSPTGGAQPGTALVVEDDLDAVTNGFPLGVGGGRSVDPSGGGAGNSTTIADLNARAAERAADVFRRLKSPPLSAVFAGARSGPGFLPGSSADRVEWRETASGISPAKGLVTEVRRASAPTRDRWTRDVPPPDWYVLVVEIDINRPLPAGLRAWQSQQGFGVVGGAAMAVPVGRNGVPAAFDGARGGQTPGVILLARKNFYGALYGGSGVTTKFADYQQIPAVPTGKVYAGYPVYVEAGGDPPLMVIGGVVAGDYGTFSPVGVLNFDPRGGLSVASASGDPTVQGDAFVSVAVTKSVQIVATGTRAGDGRTISSAVQLVNDAASPGANKVYGTDGSGVKGWQAAGGGGGGAGLTGTYP